MMIEDDDIELPPETQELIDTYVDNCCEIENQALDMLCLVEIPLFSALRNLSAQKCYSIMARMRDWFGSTPRKEHYLCLMIVTDYISCSYNNNDFYGTFVKEKKDKFYESFFVKLLNEWKVVFHKMPFTVLPSLDQFNLLKNSLRVSISRFPSCFRFEGLLTEVMIACDEYGSRLQKHLSDLKAKQNFKISLNVANTSLPVSLSNSSTDVRTSNGSKSASISNPLKVVDKSITPKAMRTLPHNSLVKRNSVPSTPLTHKSKKIDFSAPLSGEVIKSPPVIVIDDSPVKVDKTKAKLDNITNVISSKTLKRPAETGEVFKPLNMENKMMKCQNDNTVSDRDRATKTSLPRKLNAFDILMRKKVIKTVS